MRKIMLILATEVVAVGDVLAPSAGAFDSEEADIVTTAVNNGSFKTLASPLGLVSLDTLKARARSRCSPRPTRRSRRCRRRRSTRHVMASNAVIHSSTRC